MSKEEIIRIIKCYEQDRYFGVLPEDKYECVANDIFKLSNQNTKPLIEKISSLEASLLDVTRKSCARVDELTDEIAKLKASKSEANEADLDLIWTDVCISIVNRENNRVPFVDTLKYLKSKFTITRNNK